MTESQAAGNSFYDLFSLYGNVLKIIVILKKYTQLALKDQGLGVGGYKMGKLQV